MRRINLGLYLSLDSMLHLQAQFQPRQSQIICVQASHSLRLAKQLPIPLSSDVRAFFLSFFLPFYLLSVISALEL